MIEIRAYKAKHLELIDGRQYERDLTRLAARAGISFARTFAQGPGFTAFENGKAVMAGGVVPTWRDGVGEAWMHISPWIEVHPKAAARCIYRMLGRALLEHPFVRVEAAICAEMPKNQRLAEFAGFRREGLMKRWGPDGRDYYQYAMVAPEGETLCLRPQS